MKTISNLKHRLTFFGFGGYMDKENSSAMIEIEDKLLIIDCGNTVHKTIEYIGYNKHKLKNIDIIITHTHADHVGGLSTLLLYLKYETDIKARVITTPIIFESINKIINICGVKDEDISFKVSSYYVSIYENIYVRMIKTTHVRDIQSYGILIIDKKNRYNIYYSGDSKYVPTKIMKMLIRGKIQEYYQDIALDKPSEAHMSMKFLKERVLPLINENTEVYHYHNRHGWREVEFN